MEFKQRGETEDDLLFLIASLADANRWLAELDEASIPSIQELKDSVMTAQAAAHRALAELRLVVASRLRRN